MTTEQQNKTWANIPKEAKKLVRNLYNTSHIPQYEAVLELLFGSHNLEAEAHKATKGGAALSPAPSGAKHGLKVGDMVVVTGGGSLVDYVGEILSFDEDLATIQVGLGYIDVPVSRLEPCTGPSEEDNGTGMPTPTPPGYIDDDYYEARRVELAMSVAMDYAKKGRYEPSEIGAKAVEVANGVVEQLKKKQCR